MSTFALEVRILLHTATKLFCADAVEGSVPPNTHVCPVCLGLPGALPLLNRRVPELAARAALALGCAVPPRSVFVRAHTADPAHPKGYVLTQHAKPFATGGALDVSDNAGGERRVRIRSLVLREDGGRISRGADYGAMLLDFNRAGAPLLVIRTERDLRDAAEARHFLVALTQLLDYVGVIRRAVREHGRRRVGCTIAIAAAGEPPAPALCELENEAALDGVERALEAALARGEMPAGPASGPAAPRYLADPDVPPVAAEPAWLDRQRALLPELPAERAARLARCHGLRPEQARALTATRDLADYFEGVVLAGAGAAEAAGWVLTEVPPLLQRLGIDADELPARPPDTAALLDLVARGVIAPLVAGAVFARMVETGRTPAQLIGEARMGGGDSALELGR